MTSLPAAAWRMECAGIQGIAPEAGLRIRPAGASSGAVVATEGLSHVATSKASALPPPIQFAVHHTKGGFSLANDAGRGPAPSAPEEKRDELHPRASAT